MSMYEMEQPMGGDMGGGMAPGMAEEGGLDPDEKAVIQALEAITSKEPDDAKSAQLAKIVADLYKLLADEQDAKMSAMGGNPKQLRAVARAQQQ
jgi:hypothetical protein